MKNVITLVVLGLTLTACGNSEFKVIELPPPAPPVADEPAPFTLEGYFALPDGGYLDIFQDAQGLITIRSARIVLRNADGSLGVLPIASMTAAATTNGVLFSNTNQTYVAATHNVQQDSNNADLVGSFLTELQIHKNENGLLRVNVTIVSVSSVLIARTLKQL